MRFAAWNLEHHSRRRKQASNSADAWQKLTDLPPAATNRVVEIPDPDINQSGRRFYRLVTPTQDGARTPLSAR